MSYYITLFGKEIPLYGIFFYIGIACAATVALLISRRRSLPSYEIAYSAVYTIIGALLGAKLLFILTSWKMIVALDLSLLAIIRGGFVFYGGMLGGILGLFIYAKQFKMPILPFLDVYATVLPLGHALGRVGCFFGGCCYGVEHDGIFSVTYTEVSGITPLHTPLLAIQLIEAFCLLLLFAVMLLVLFRTKRVGLPTALYAAMYTVVRFVLEFFRGDRERGIFLLSTSQWISVLILLATLSFLFLSYKRKKRLE